jgi:hypothetical protein
MMLNIFAIYAALAIGGILGYLMCSLVVIAKQMDMDDG